MNISVGAKNLKEKKNFELMPGKQKMGKIYIRERRGEMFTVRSCKLSEVQFLFY